MELNLKLDLVVEFNEETSTLEVISVNDAKFVSKKTSKPKIVKNQIPEDNSPEPTIKLETGKYFLNQAAIELLGVKADDRLDIKYKKVENITYPVIGTDTAFGTKVGNKLTKSNTVSLRGVKHEKLSEYGDTFTLIPFKDNGELFVLVGNKIKEPTPVVKEFKDEIKIKEDDDISFDLSEEIKTELDDAEEIDLDELTL